MSLIEEIRKSKFILDFQREKIIKMVEDNEVLYGEDDCMKLIDIVFRKLFDRSVYDLSPEETIMLKAAIAEFQYRDWSSR